MQVSNVLPTRVGRYELLASVGSGGMATVYLARHAGPAGYERHIALKLLHPHMRSDPQAVVDFIQEARLASELRHPNIVQVLDVDDQPEGLFMVMEHIEGGSLAALLRGRFSLPLPISLRLLTDALAGLHHAHQHKDVEGRPLQIVHRDFTPQNILAGVDGVAKLTDFGIAKVLGATQRTTTGIVKGKVRYMAPEQAEGRQVDARTDIWAAGVVAWELVTRRRLYRGDNEVAILLEIVRDRPARAKSVRPDISTDLDEAIARALEPDPSKRYATADAFREALILAAPEIADLAETSAFVRQAFEDTLSSRRQVISSSVARALAASKAMSMMHPRGEAETAVTTAYGHRTRRRAFLGSAAAMALFSVAAGVFALSRTAPREPAALVAASSESVAASAEADEGASSSATPETPLETPVSPSATTESRVTPKRTRPPRQAPRVSGGSAAVPKLLRSPYDGGR